MTGFERIYQTDPSREYSQGYEKHPSIEMSDEDYIKSKTQLVYKPPIESEMTPALKEKFEKAKRITKDTKVIDLRGKDEKSKSKSAKGKPKKNNSKPLKSAV